MECVQKWSISIQFGKINKTLTSQNDFQWRGASNFSPKIPITIWYGKQRISREESMEWSSKLFGSVRLCWFFPNLVFFYIFFSIRLRLRLLQVSNNIFRKTLVFGRHISKICTDEMMTEPNIRKYVRYST